MAGSTPINVLQQVQTYQKAEIAYLENSFCGINISNKRFKNFNDKVANLGDTVTFERAMRFRSYPGLVITQQPTQQEVQSLICSQSYNVSQGYTDQQFMFNIRDYMTEVGMAAMQELGTAVETDILKNITSSIVVTDPQSANYGTTQLNSGPFRCYGNGINPISSSNQLAQAVANFEDFGSAKHMMKGILPVANIPAIIGTNLNQFAVNRNNDEAMSWELGKFANTDWYTSNLLPLHLGGNIGNAAAPNNILTVVATNDPTGNNITQITFTEPTGSTDINAIKAGDIITFIDVAGFTKLRFLTYIGHVPCSQYVQFRVTADAATNAGTVIVNVQTTNGVGLVSAPNRDQNLNAAIVAGMQAVPTASHRAGVLMSGNQFYLAMPRLPDESPFTTSNMTDPDSGTSIRHYFGSQFGQNNRAYVRDTIYGSTMVAENCMRLAFPL